ncbi:hypothetical protein AVMA1855_25160 [Acidovorax sp. SUPP1855]|uniref:hypothetical protein n=1 Tax=Acidovorax sp. SUPP1855 TaxID=431774 RepID=UPI0023DE3595|nr:hypothetical protein [Acidovorax sp. SUPP1855]GKS87506.1 hypothetical protein AVMA1855_25160 [Acidovorax sp. SUPP1855]
MINSVKILDNFFSIIQEEGVSLASEGVDDMALPLHAALHAITILRTSCAAAKGGEVWEKVGDRFKPTYDGWNSERADYSSESEYIEATLDAAEKVVVFYSSRGGEFYIVFGV